MSNTHQDPPYHVHISEVNAWKKCRRLHNWSARDVDNLEPKKAYSPFFIGRAWHNSVEMLTADGMSPLASLSPFLREELKVRKQSPLWEIDRDTVRTDVRLTRAMLDQYVAWAKSYKGVYADKYLDYIAHEMSFGEPHTHAIPLMAFGRVLQPIVYLEGKFDGLVKWNPPNESSQTLLKEYKTCRSVAERVRLLPQDEQATAYCYAAQQLFHQPVDGILYTLARKKAAATPKVLQNGMLSKNKQIDTDEAGYLAAIRRHHGKDVGGRFIRENYGDILEHLRFFAEPFVARVLIERSQTQIDLYIQELHATVLEMRSYHTPAIINATRTWTCPNCFFHTPCLMRDLGDEEGVRLNLEMEFQQRPQSEPQEEVDLG